MIKFPINYFCHFDRSEKHLCFISKVCFQMWNAIYRIESTMEFELLAHSGCREMGRKIGMHFLLLYIWIPISRYMTNSCIVHVVAEISYQQADISHCLHFEFFFTLELNPSYAMEIANMARICICLVDNSLVKETIWHAFNLL